MSTALLAPGTLHIQSGLVQCSSRFKEPCTNDIPNLSCVPILTRHSPKVNIAKPTAKTVILRAYPSSPRKPPVLQPPILNLLLMTSKASFLVYLIRLSNPSPHILHRSRVRRNSAAVPPNLLLFALDVGKRSFRGDGGFIGEDEDLFALSSVYCALRFSRGVVPYILVFAEHAVDILEFAVRGLRVEEVDDGDEGGVEDGPDDVEFPL